MTTHIRIDLERQSGTIHPNLYGGFAEHLGRCIYGGIYDPASPHAGADGLRQDVLAALKRLRMPVMRYPGGNFVSGYRWRDGVGPRAERPTRLDLAWRVLESNHFGTNEFIDFCRQLNTEPYLVVNCGDGDQREARDWVEYCNGNQETALAKLRREHGYPQPHNVKYWGIGNEVDGHWQIGYKTGQEYARAFTEFGKVMKWVDPDIKLIAAAGCTWEADLVERAQLLIEQAGNLIDYMAIHWYVGNRENDFARYMTLSELFEARLSGYEGLIRALMLAQQIQHPIMIAVDEWNVNYRGGADSDSGAEETYNLEDALVVAMHLNAFMRHARSIGMTNLAQIVNVIAPIITRPEGMVLQTIFYPFELYSQYGHGVSLDVFWNGDTFSGGDYTGVRTLDIAASYDAAQQQMAVFVVNRTEHQHTEAQLSLTVGRFTGQGKAFVVNGPGIKAENTFETPDLVGTRETVVNLDGSTVDLVFEPHSVTALVFPVGR